MCIRVDRIDERFNKRICLTKNDNIRGMRLEGINYSYDCVIWNFSIFDYCKKLVFKIKTYLFLIYPCKYIDRYGIRISKEKKKGEKKKNK